MPQYPTAFSLVALLVLGACTPADQGSIATVDRGDTTLVFLPRDEAPPDPAVDSAAARDAAAPAPLPDPWFHDVRMLDVTNDGGADSLILLARGPTLDSLDVSFVVVVDGREAHRERWESDDELLDLRLAVSQPSQEQVRDALRTGLGRFLEGVRLVAPDTSCTGDRNWEHPAPVTEEVSTDDPCWDDPRNWIAWGLKEAAGATVPRRVTVRRAIWDTVAVDTTEVNAIWRGILERGTPFVSFFYGYDLSNRLVWSERSNRFFAISPKHEGCC